MTLAVEDINSKLQNIVAHAIEVASVINRRGLACAGIWYYQIYLPAIDTLVTGMAHADIETTEILATARQGQNGT